MGTTAGQAEEFHNAVSLQGFTGLLNTPNAEVTDEGKFYALFSNQRENLWQNRSDREASYIFSVGFFSFLELGGRLTDAPRIRDNTGITDLSANFKVKVPFIPKGYYLPDVAFGMQDVGGGAKNLQTTYVVASEEVWRFRLSVGYGAGPDRMKGAFGGAEFRAFDWLYLIGENDTKETNVGARLVTPEFCGIPVNLQLTAKTSLDYRPGNLEFGFGLQFPLGRNRRNTTPLPEKAGETEAVTTAAESRPPSTGKQPSAAGNQRPAASSQPPVASGQPVPSPQSPVPSPQSRLLEKLVAGGFQNVRVGSHEHELLVVEYENSRYNHNELDALGVVIGTVVDTIPSGFETLRVVVRKKGIRVLQLSAPLDDFRAFLHDPEKYAELNEKLRISYAVSDEAQVRFVEGSGNPSWLTSELIVYPALKTFVGTEVGNFDYLLSLKLDYYLNAWKGAVLNTRLDVPVAWSKNFDDGKVFSVYRKNSQLDRLMLLQTLKVAPQVALNLGGGMILHDTYGTLNEIMWTPGDGTHRFSAKQAYLSNAENHQKSEVYLGAYRYYLSPLELYLEGTGGKFLDNDKGFRIDVKRFFGDTAFSVFYKNSRTPAGAHVQFGGVQVAFPLTPRRDMKPYLVQLKGTNEWSYAQETKIASHGEANTVSTSVGVDPQLPYNLEKVFFNRDRLSEPYIRTHLLWLRDAYLTYGR